MSWGFGWEGRVRGEKMGMGVVFGGGLGGRMI